jgi:glycogen debranching enzyme
MAEPEQAQAMISTYVINEQHFWSPYGIRSLSKSSEFFNNAVWGNPSRFGDHRRMNESNWQGPVWMPINYFVFHALRHYGFAQEAGELADRAVGVLAGSLRLQGSFSENFNSETGEPLYAKHYASWNLLGDTLHDDLASGNWIMDPVFAED